MEGIGHEAIGPNRNAELSTRFCEPIAIGCIVPRLEENPFTAIAPLSHLMWRMRNDDAGDARHGETLTRAERKGKHGRVTVNPPSCISSGGAASRSHKKQAAVCVSGRRCRPFPNA